MWDLYGCVLVEGECRHIQCQHECWAAGTDTAKVRKRKQIHALRFVDVSHDPVQSFGIGHADSLG